MIWVIARREACAMFLSPLAWVILAVIQTILGYMFLANLDNFFVLQPQLIQIANTPGVTDIVITPLMQVAAIILLMVMPLMTMRSLAEEKRNRTLSLLISAPLGMSEIVLGKFFGLVGFIVVLVSLLMLGLGIDFFVISLFSVATFTAWPTTLTRSAMRRFAPRTTSGLRPTSA